MLRPDGNHGQGDVFLSSFLNLVGIESSCSLQNVSVITEASTNTGRRIDLLIQTDEWIIGIENKPWAQDQENQLIDYYEYVRKIAGKNKKYAIIYLSGGNTAPSDLTEKQIEQTGNKTSEFIMMRYCGEGFYNGRPPEQVFTEFSIQNDLRTWLKQCTKLCDASHVTTLIEHFIQYIEKHFSNNEGDNMTEVEQNILSYIRSDKDRVRLAMNIDRTALANIITDDFIEALQSSFISEYGKKHPDEPKLEHQEDLIGKLSKNQWPKISFFHKKWPTSEIDEAEKHCNGRAISLVLEKERDRLYWGIKGYKDCLSPEGRNLLIERLKELDKEKTDTPTDWWPWWYKSEPWADFRNPNTLARIANLESETAKQYISNTTQHWMKAIDIVNSFIENDYTGGQT